MSCRKQSTEKSELIAYFNACISAVFFVRTYALFCQENKNAIVEQLVAEALFFSSAESI